MSLIGAMLAYFVSPLIADVSIGSARQLATWGGQLTTTEIHSWSKITVNVSDTKQSRSLMECFLICIKVSSVEAALWSSASKSCYCSSLPCSLYTSRTGSGYYCGRKTQWSLYGTSSVRGCRAANVLGIRESGVLFVDPDGNGAIPVLCEFSGSDSWITIQRRQDGSQNFYLDWQSYRNGFGGLAGEFWLGLENIRRLVAGGVKLSIYMEAFDGSSAYANYSTFSIGLESTRYMLNVSGYSGTAGDSLTYHDGFPFSTMDNDSTASHCATRFQGAWWYRTCHQSNLNGLYLKGNTSQFATAACWVTFKGFYYALKTTTMRILV